MVGDTYGDSANDVVRNRSAYISRSLAAETRPGLEQDRPYPPEEAILPATPLDGRITDPPDDSDDFVDLTSDEHRIIAISGETQILDPIPKVTRLLDLPGDARRRKIDNSKSMIGFRRSQVDPAAPIQFWVPVLQMFLPLMKITYKRTYPRKEKAR